MNTTMLALDLGTTTGWALSSRDGHITSGSESFKPGRFEGGGMRYLRIKKHATGKGNAGKAAMIAAARARGFDPQDDNEADALALLAWATAQEDAA